MLSLADVRGIADRTRAERRRRSPASRVLADVERANARLGHENLGPLSPSTGFLPGHPPLQSFSPRHAAWDRVAAELPQLYESLAVRSTVQAMPVLAADPAVLPDHELARAATVLGVVAHAYFHQSLSDAPRLPASIAEPWARVLHRLGRPAEPVLSYQDLIINNWRAPGARRAAGAAGARS